MEHLVQYKIEAIDKITGVYRTLIGLQDKAAGKTAATNSATTKANKAMNQLAKTTTATGEKMSNSMKYAVLRFQRTKKTIDDTEKSIKKTGSTLDWLKGKVGGVERRFSVMGGRIKGALGKITNTLGGFGTTMAGIFTLDLVKDTFNSLTTAASDLNESTNKAKVVFGANFTQISKFADDASKTIGMSKQQTLEASSTFASLFKGMGFGMQQTTKLSEGMVRLAADLGSLNNLSSEEALGVISSGLRGEMEPLTRVGVVLNEATLKQKAYSMGLISSTRNALTPAIKAQATIGALIERTKDAQGDFARTSMDLAGATKILTADQADMRAELGQKLLPIKLKLVNLMIKAVGWVRENADMLIKWGEKAVYVGGALLGLFMAAKTIIGVAAFYSTITEAITLLRNSTILATVATKLHSVASFISMMASNGLARSMVFARLRMIAFNVVARLSPFGWIAMAIGGIILLVKHWDTVKVYLANFAKWAWGNHPFKWIIDLVDRVFPGFKSSLSNMFESVKDVLLKGTNWIYDNVIKKLFGWLEKFGVNLGISTKSTIGANLTMGGGDDRKDLYKTDRGAFDYNGVLGLGSGDGKVKDIGVKSANESLVSGGGKEMKTINIRIDKLIESFNISTQTFGASAAQIKSEVQKILLSAVNEVNYQ